MHEAPTSTRRPARLHPPPSQSQGRWYRRMSPRYQRRPHSTRRASAGSPPDPKTAPTGRCRCLSLAVGAHHWMPSRRRCRRQGIGLHGQPDPGPARYGPAIRPTEHAGPVPAGGAPPIRQGGRREGGRLFQPPGIRRRAVIPAASSGGGADGWIMAQSLWTVQTILYSSHKQPFRMVMRSRPSFSKPSFSAGGWPARCRQKTSSSTRTSMSRWSAGSQCFPSGWCPTPGLVRMHKEAHPRPHGASGDWAGRGAGAAGYRAVVRTAHKVMVVRGPAP